jgi:redox-sensitive bicupin YhaK (pirin superfamily)
MAEGWTIRAIARRIKAHRQTEGAGFVVRRPIPTFGLDLFDPFLLIDEMGPVEYGPGEAVGAPDHPHRGFETVTYMLDGEGEHEDSVGHRGVIGPGAVQWMTAGSGVVHSEMPSRRLRELGGKMHGFQIWVNLPSNEKMSPPRYQELSASDIPKATTDDGLARVSVIAGEALGVRASIDTHTPIVYQDWTLDPGADVSVHIPDDHNVCAYVFQGEANAGSELERVSDGELVIFGSGNTVRLASKDTVRSARLLLLGGRPIREPVARYGPFVMNTKQELMQAFEDYEAGKMGRIVRTP